MLCYISQLCVNFDKNGLGFILAHFFQKRIWLHLFALCCTYVRDGDVALFVGKQAGLDVMAASF
jgi:hypothetical protein